jgi:hypothetical protein
LLRTFTANQLEGIDVTQRNQQSYQQGGQGNGRGQQRTQGGGGGQRSSAGSNYGDFHRESPNERGSQMGGYSTGSGYGQEANQQNPQYRESDGYQEGNYEEFSSSQNAFGGNSGDAQRYGQGGWNEPYGMGRGPGQSQGSYGTQSRGSRGNAFSGSLQNNQAVGEGQYGQQKSSYTHGGYNNGGAQEGNYSSGNQGQSQFDPDFSQWRTKQIDNLDSDYKIWCEERYKKFSDEFDTWRGNRAQPSASASTASTSEPVTRTAQSK